MTTETKKPARLSIHMEPVESSQIKSIGYDPAHQTMAVVFTCGDAEYHYPNVTQAQFDAFKGADSWVCTSASTSSRARTSSSTTPTRAEHPGLGPPRPLSTQAGDREQGRPSQVTGKAPNPSVSQQLELHLKVITPTIGRRVWYWPSTYDRGLLSSKPESIIKADVESSGQPCDAGVVRVWGDRMVNLTIADHNGNMHKRTSVTLVQPGDTPPADGGYCTWMDCQVAQAEKEAPIPLGRVGELNHEGPDHADDTRV